MIITLCGSSRFADAFHLANMHFTMMGHVVLSLGVFGHADQPMGAKYLTGDGVPSRQKEELDKLHFQKIDMADVVVVVNVGDYIGPSTMKEIEYARSKGKRVFMLFPRISL